MKRLLPFILLLACTTLAANAEPLGPAPSLDDLRAEIFAPREAAGAPAATKAITCSATNDCGPNSPTITCSAPTPATCTSGFDFVECGGVRRTCAPCSVTTRCTLDTNPKWISCTGTNITNCEVEPHCFVQCGSTRRQCNVCP